MALRANSLILDTPPTADLIDEQGRPTSLGAQLAHELVEHARSLEARFGTLRSRMYEYEDWWLQNGKRWTSGKDKELADTLPIFPNSKGRILIAKATRANTKERVGFKIAIGADWTNDQTKATQALERYCYGSIWMADQERRARSLDQIQPSLTWFGAARGGAVAIPFVRSSNRQKDGDGYGDLEPYVVRTPDPLTCVWDEGSYGLTFFASADWRPQSDFYGMVELEGIRPSRQKDGYCETFNVWWCDQARNVWNATVVDGCYLIPPTNHSTRRGLKRLPVVIDTPGYGSPKEALVGGSDNTSLADHYRGVLENNLNSYAVEAYIDSIQMRLMQDAAQWGIAVAAERNIPADELKEAMKGNAAIMLGPNDRLFPIAPPQLSDTAIRWKQELDARQQLGGMPNTAIAGVSMGMTGVAIQEAILQGDFAAGPISDMLKRMHEEVVRCFLTQHRALGRKVKVKGPDKSGMFIAKIDASELPPPDEYILQAVHKPALVRDGYRDAQEALTWKSAGRSFAAVADDKLDDPQREVELVSREQLEANPLVSLALQVEEAIEKYGQNSMPVLILSSALKQAMVQIMAPSGPTNSPAPGTAMDAAPLPQLEGGPAIQLPAGVDPNDPAAQAMLGQMGAEMGGNPNGY